MNKSMHSQSKWVIPLVSLVTFVGFLDTHLLLPLMALYASSLGAGAGIIGIIIGLYSITNTGANVLFGRLVDRIGYKFPLLAGLLGDAVCMLLYTICRLPVHLAVVRAAHGTSGGMVGPATMSATANLSGREKGRAMGIYGMSISAASLVGFGVSAVLVARYGYTGVFFFGALLLFFGMGGSLFLPRVKKSIPELSSSGISRMTLFKRKGLTIAYCSIFSQYFTLGGIVTLLPLYIAGLEMEAFHVGMLLAIFSIISLVLQVPSGILSDKVGRVPLVVISLCLCTVSVILIPFMMAFVLLAGTMILYGAAHGMLFPSISALIADNTLPEERGTATGAFHALITIGTAVGAPVTGWLGEVVGVKGGLASAAVVPAVVLVITLIVHQYGSKLSNNSHE